MIEMDLIFLGMDERRQASEPSDLYSFTSVLINICARIR